jgi:hypothetical protein
VALPADPRLEELCELAQSAARGKGHDLGGWTGDGDAEVARTATCARCGRRVHVRVGAGMTGMAGAALTEPCAQAREAGAQR